MSPHGPGPAPVPRFETGATLLDRYDLIARLGQGGMGVVWRARDRELDLDVALKLLPLDIAETGRAFAQLRREAQTAIRLTHANIVKLLHFHSTPDLAFVEMEYVPGVSLEHVLRVRGPRTEDELRAWMLQVCEGLAEAHAHGVVHLDIKPGNLMLTPDGRIKIADFGISRVLADTRARIGGYPTSGTPFYMPPEQIVGRPCDGRADLYALGVTAYELLKGRPPFHRGDVVHQQLHEPPPALSIEAPHLWPILKRLLAKVPADRYPDARAVQAALETSLPASDVPLAVMFTDIGNAAALHDRLGNAQLRDLIRDYQEVVRGELAAYGGEEIKTLGDGFLLAFADVDAAVACAVAIQRAMTESALAPGARIALQYGQVLRAARDLYGQTVSMAARVLDIAQPGQILVAAGARDRAADPPAAAFAERGRFRLKGHRERERLWEVLWSPDATRIPPRAAPLDTGSDRVSFVGRDLELRALEHALEHAEAGQGGFVVLSGEPGVGKTRLAREFLRRIQRRRVAATFGRCYEELTTPWQPVVECMSRLRMADGGWTIPDHLQADLRPLARSAPELCAALNDASVQRSMSDPAEERSRLLAACGSVFLEWSHRQTLLLFLDDVQWADANTLDVLRHLGRRLLPDLSDRGARLLAIMTCRETALQAGHPLNELLADLERDALLTRLPVRGLGAHEVQALLRDLHGQTAHEQLATFVFHQSQGNPYFVEEIYRDLAEQRLLDPAAAGELEIQDDWFLSTRVKDVIEKRLSRVDTGCRHVLRVAALLGQRFRYDVWRAATGRSDDELLVHIEDALAAHLLREMAGEEDVYYTFEHALAAEALAEEGSLARRQRIHLRIADALETVHGPHAREHAAETLRHLLEAGARAGADRVALYGHAAGNAALDRYAFAEAASYYETARQAIARLGSASPVTAVDVDLHLFQALGQLGRVDEALSLANAVIASCEETGAQELAQEARLHIAIILRRHAREHSALPYLTPVIEHGAATPTDRYADALYQYAFARVYAGEPGGILPAAEELTRIARQTQQPYWGERALIVQRVWSVHHRGDFAHAAALGVRVIKHARQRDDRWWLCRELGDLAWLYFMQGQVEKALVTAAEAIALAEQTGTHYEVVDNCAVRAICHCFRGEWDQVDDVWARVAPHLNHVPSVKRMGLLTWARVRTDLWLGHPSLQMRSTRQNYADMPRTKLAVLASLVYRGAQEGVDGTAARAGALSAHVPESGAGLMWLIAAQALTAAWADLERPREAVRWYGDLTAKGNVLYLSSTSLELGRAASLNHWWKDAGRHFAAATRHCRREGLAPLLGITLYEKAKMYLARNGNCDTRRAREALREAGPLFGRLQMDAYAARTAALAERL